jgi:hypothetical protein
MPDCDFCGTPFVKERKAGKGRQIYCGIDCAQEVIHIKSGHYYRLGDADKRAAIMQRERDRKRARMRPSLSRAV